MRGGWIEEKMKYQVNFSLGSFFWSYPIEPIIITELE